MATYFGSLAVHADGTVAGCEHTGSNGCTSRDVRYELERRRDAGVPFD